MGRLRHPHKVNLLVQVDGLVVGRHLEEAKKEAKEEAGEATNVIERRPGQIKRCAGCKNSTCTDRNCACVVAAHLVASLAKQLGGLVEKKKGVGCRL